MRLLHMLMYAIAFSLTACPRSHSTPDEPVDFRQHIAPILERRCLGCHAGEKAKGGLSLESAKGLRAGGETGPALVAGNPNESLLVRMITGPKPRMPLKAAPLSPVEVERIRRWIGGGASWPEQLVLKAAPGSAETWWSLRPLQRPLVPVVAQREWVRNPIDAFILKKLEELELSPSAEADRRTLIRRVTFALHGLPPTPEEVEAFLADDSTAAYERLVDRLLASPRYGERWGRHWLDVVHYGDTHGYDKDKRRNNAWPYRDYVIRSLNADKPYTQFVKEQLAGDRLQPGEAEGIIATGFIAAGPWDFVGHVELREGTVEKEKTRNLDRDDVVANTMSTFASLTVHCARCHEHKFDPITQSDYYRLQAVFAGVERGDRVYRRTGAGPLRMMPELKVYSALPRAPRPIHMLHRGDVEQRREASLPGAITAIGTLDPDFRLPLERDESTGRLALADWLTHRENPLTWRSIVNRVWHYHFGRGIVDTPNDFGRNGSLPTHPKLLDWLASEFRDSGQSLKQLHRLIVTSAAYRQSSNGDRNQRAARSVDADNRYLWRMNRQRLDAEAIRDAVLAVSGQLDDRMGGPGYDLFRFRDDHSPEYDHSAVERIRDPATYRRTVYRFVVRSVPNPFLDCLDCADPNQNVPVRNATLTALQALALLNDPFMLRQAEHLAWRVESVSPDRSRQLDRLFHLLYARPADDEERGMVTQYAEKHGLVSACRTLLNANEFVFVD
jgi:mono/diheme cytochrome c family protein